MLLAIFGLPEQAQLFSRVSPKVNLGYRAGLLNLTAYLIAWNEEFVDMFDLNQVGATIGFRF